jgi:hypothetical protein
LDVNRAREITRIQNALAEQTAAKQRVIALVVRGKTSDEDADSQLDVINAEEARLYGQLYTLETNRSLADRGQTWTSPRTGDEPSTSRCKRSRSW